MAINNQLRKEKVAMPEFTLPPLPYPYEALEPTIDTTTMQIHHDKHHQAYVTNLNNALKEHPEFFEKSAEWIVGNLNAIPEPVRTAVRNNAGGHVNHTFFWEIMTPGGSKEPTGALAEAIKTTFGDVDALKKAINEAGAKRFGSGWSWLVADASHKLSVVSTPNQDSPLIEGHHPILGVDVWEHAYYLKYQNRRPDYLTAWWNVVNWDVVGKHYDALK
jgi:Fe-Mn family superoxide dismutase